MKSKARAIAQIALIGIAVDAVPALAAELSGAPGRGFEEVVVTARKRAENLQKVPVAVTAITTDELREKSITNPYDLTFNAPGLNVRQGGSTRDSPDYFIRGQGNTFGANPGVLTYFNEVPLGSLAINANAPVSNLQIFDIASVQVLKGPQGTLFGKSSTGGAVLFSPKKPTNEFGGYLDGQIGNYNMWEIQGALNLPIVKDKLAIRAAVDVVRRDGFTTSLSTGQEQDQRHRESYRLGINFTPTDWLTSYTLLQHSVAQEVPSSNVLLDYDPNFALFNTTPGVGAGYFAVAGLCAAITAPAGVPACIATRTGRIDALTASLAAEQARVAGGGSVRNNQTNRIDAQNFSAQTITNITSLNIGEVPVLGEITFKNIFSAFRIPENNVIREFGATSLPHGVVINQYDLTGFPQTPTRNKAFEKYGFGNNTTEEFQIQGNVHDKHSWILGYFLASATLDRLQVPPIFPSFNNAFTVPLDSQGFIFGTSVVQSSQAEAGYYAQFTADLSDLVLKGLRLTGGFRWSRDYTKQTFVNNVPTLTGLQAGSIARLQNFHESAPSYTVTVDYQVNPDVMIYVTTRRGFKPGGVNGTAASAGIPGVKPTFSAEVLEDVEGGFKSEWALGGIRGRSNLAAYHSWYSNVQRSEVIAIPASLGGGVTTQTNNIAAAEITGVEIENNFKLAEGLTAFLNYAWTDAEYTEYPGSTLNTAGVLVPNINAPYVGVPEHQGTVGLRYVLPLDQTLGEIAVSGEYYRQTSFWLDDSALQDAKPIGRQKGYGNLNMRIDWNSILGSSVDAAFFVRNATDNLHLVGVGNLISSFGYAVGTYNEPRTFGFELRARFGADAE